MNVKLRVVPSWPSIQKRIFPALTRRLTGEEPLVSAFRRLSRLGAVAGSTSPLLISALIEVLCLWPRGTGVETFAKDGGACGDPRVDDVMAIIDEHLDQPPSLGELARRVDLSPRHLVRRFETLCGCSPHDYITARRLGRARELLAQGSMNVTRAAEALGFPSIHTFSRWFRRETGLTPAEFRAHPTGF
jgi:AraC-like DNA-binding protein